MMRKLLLFSLIGFFSITFAWAQTGSVSGTIKDSEGLELIGANVILKGTTVGTITNIDGEFTLSNMDAGTQTFVASFIGYNSEEMTVEISAGGTATANFVLIEDVTTLDELVVIGYGVQRKEDKTGAVAQIKSDDLLGGAITDPLQSMAGKAPGVVVTKGGGNPTDDAKVKIRGSAGIGNSSDGGTNTNPLYVINGVPGADPNMLAPGDIESMNILKDAASTAIYGSQGANGVIIITTKSGKTGSNVVNFSSVTSFDNVARKLDFMSGEDYRAMGNDSVYVDNFIDGGGNTDWQDEIYRMAIGQQYNLSMSGGTEKGTYYASLSHQNTEGIIKESSRKRTIGNLNFTHKAFNEKVTFAGGLNVAFEEDNLVQLGSNSRDDVLYQTYRRNPTDSAYNADGSINYDVLDPSRGFDYVNPLGVLMEEDRVDERKKILGNISANYEIIDGLNFKLATSYLSSDKEYTYYRPAGIYDGQGNDLGEGQRYYEVSTQQNLEATLNYAKTFNEMHNLNLLAGYSWQENNFSKFGVEARNSQSTSVRTNNMESFLDIVYGDATSEANMSRLIGFFGRVNYNFDNKYYAGASLRQDGSSKFGENNKWGLFPTASLGWNMHREGFLENTAWLSQLKLRASYGVSGNQSFSSYNSKVILAPSSVVVDPSTGNEVISWSADRNGNPNLKWEETSEINLGIDYGIFNSRVSGSLELYQKNTTDMLNNYSVPTPPNTYPQMWLNAGAMTNQGFEFFVMAHVVDNSNFSWKTTFGISKNTGKITSLGDNWSQEDSRQGWISGQGIVGGSNWTMFIEEDQPIGNFYLFEYAGIVDGVDMYINHAKIDEAGNPVEEADTVDAKQLTIEDRYVAGNATPKMEFSWSNNLRIYQNWTIDFSLRALTGQDVYNHTSAYFSSPSWMPYANVLDNAQQYIDEGFGGQFTVPSDEFLEKASFLRLDYLSLGYTFNFQDNNYIKNLKLSVMSNNLFVLTNYTGADPEMSIDGLGYGVDSFGVYPKSRTFSFGINATF